MYTNIDLKNLVTASIGKIKSYPSIINALNQNWLDHGAHTPL